MSDFINANELKERVSLLRLLENLGHRPVRVSGGTHYFLSMFREERTPSLCVNDTLGVWFDHGGAGSSGIKSGTVIDFGLAYWYPSSFSEVLGKIRDAADISLSSESIEATTYKRDRKAVKIPNYKIESVRDIGGNAAISSYLQSRGIWGVADGHLSEIYYYVLDDQKRRKDFFSAGWANENGGWEVRNKYFKGCLGHKGVSFFEGSPDHLCIFEGYFDFLSWKFDYEGDKASILVLNSLALLDGAIPRTMPYSEVDVYFDNDRAGSQATAELLSRVPQARDSSHIYAGFKDYNEKLMAEFSRIGMSKVQRMSDRSNFDFCR